MNIPKDKWFLEFPTHRYNEDVKALAREARVFIVDAKYKNDPIGNFAASKVPTVTLKKEFAPVEVPKPKKAKAEKEE